MRENTLPKQRQGKEKKNQKNKKSKKRLVTKFFSSAQENEDII